MPKKVFLFLLLSLQFYASGGQDRRVVWVDSVFNTLSRTAKVGQLFMVSLGSGGPEEEISRVNSLTRGRDIGSVYITGGGPKRHARMLNELQTNSKVPLLAGISAEWGLAQTLDSTMGFQKAMAASAWRSDSLVTLWGKEIARQMKMLGLHINFAPNVDDRIFENDYLRYFSNEPSRVGERAVSFSRAQQSEGVLTVARHLPDMGRTSEGASPVINIDQVSIDGLPRLGQVIANGVNGVLTTDIHAFTQNEGRSVPPSVSPLFVTEILKEKMNFNGLLFADVNTFRKNAGKVRAGEAELLAFQSGHDVLMNPLNINTAIRKIQRKAKRDKLLQQQLDRSVKKILAAKFDARLDKTQLVNTDNLSRKLHSPEAYFLRRQLAEATVTTIKNGDAILPIRNLEDREFTSISLGGESQNEFTDYLGRYTSFQNFSIKDIADTAAVYVRPGEIVVLALFPHSEVLANKLTFWSHGLLSKSKVIVVNFSNPSASAFYSGASAVINAYTDKDDMASVVPQVIFGAIPSVGVSPVTVGDIKAGEGTQTKSLQRIGYSVPEAAGLKSHILEKIDQIAEEAIEKKGTPGCQVLILKNGKVVYEKSFGWLTYDRQTPVTNETIFDLASITKVLATVPVTMFLYERGLIDLNKKASRYLPQLRETNKKDLSLKDILTHQSGLLPFLPMWQETMDSIGFSPIYYSRTKSGEFPLQVAPDLYASPIIRDSLWHWTLQAKLLDKAARTPYTLRYSDFGPWILYMMSERLLNQPMDDFIRQNLYEPIGSGTTGFLPLERFNVSRIAPTELDTIFRKTMVVGTVHDERAAMLGGVAGHAGLFSNANDVAKLGQMFLQKGYYGGHRYFKRETVEYFTSKQFENSRRGLGWDKPIQSDWASPTSGSASPLTFGHTGFTGTCIWIDPQFDLVYIFLSNRVHPDRSNRLLNLNIRTRIQEVIYQAMFAYCAEKK